MEKPHYLTAVFSVTLVAALLLLLPSSAESAPTSNPITPPVSTSTDPSHIAAIHLSATPARPDDTLPSNMPILANHIDGQLTYHYIPINLQDETDTLAETLVDEHPTPPQRPIFILAPERQYRLDFDFSEYAHHALAVQQDFQISFTNVLSDTQLGSIEAVITETYVDGSQAIFYGEVKFVADSPSGLTLSCIKPETNGYPTLQRSRIILFTNAGQIPSITTFTPVHWNWPQWNIRTYGHTFNVTDPAEADIESYFYPDTAPTTIPPDFLNDWVEWHLPIK